MFVDHQVKWLQSQSLPVWWFILKLSLKKLTKGGVYEKESVVYWDFQRRCLQIFLIRVHLLYSYTKVFCEKKKNICTINREQQKYIEILMLILSYENHSSTKLHMLLICISTVAYIILGNHLQIIKLAITKSRNSHRLLCFA